MVEIFNAGIERLRDELVSECDITVVAGVSNREDKAMCEAYGYHTTSISNEALGLKMNLILEEATTIEADYYMQMGSDNLVSVDWVRQAMKQIDLGADMVADRSLYFIDLYSWRACHYTYWTPDLNLCGACRLFAPHAIETMRDKAGGLLMWPDDAERGLDGKSEGLFKEMGNKVEVNTVEGDKHHLIDIKSEVNLWDFDRFYNTTNRMDVSECTWFCSPTEIEYLYTNGNLD